MKRCRKIQKDMERYLDKELLPEKIHAFEDHLRRCVRCRRILEEKREQRALRISSLMPTEIPLTTEEILLKVQGKEAFEETEDMPLPKGTPSLWEKLRAFPFRPAPAIAFALCLLALGLSLFLPFGSHTLTKPSIVIEKIASTHSFMIYRPRGTETTVIWIVPTQRNHKEPT